MFSFLHHVCTGLQSDLESTSLEAKLEENPKSSVMLTPVSEVSSMELVALSSPQISPSSQLSETASDTSAPEVADAAGSTSESGSRADASSTNGEPRADDDKDPKKSKAHLHCPVCKVTVNSISQLEAHNSGKSVRRPWSLHYFFSPFKTEMFWNASHICIRLQLPTLCCSTRHKAQTDAGGSQCSATAQGESGGGSGRLQEQAAGQQRQRWGSQQELPVWSVWDLCELWDPTEPGKIITPHMSKWYVQCKMYTFYPVKEELLMLHKSWHKWKEMHLTPALQRAS